MIHYCLICYYSHSFILSSQGLVAIEKFKVAAITRVEENVANAVAKQGISYLAGRLFRSAMGVGTGAGATTIA